MKLSETTITCANCGQSMQAIVKMSYLVTDNGLDGKPTSKALLRDIYKCPNCGYSGYNIDKIKPANPIEFNTTSNDPAIVYENALLTAKSDNAKNHLLLDYTWFLEFEGRMEEAKEVRTRAVKQIEKTLEKDPMIELGFVYVDCLRQLGRFSEAKETLDSMDETINENKREYAHLAKVYLKLRELVDIGDSSPHMQSELR